MLGVVASAGLPATVQGAAASSDSAWNALIAKAEGHASAKRALIASSDHAGSFSRTLLERSRSCFPADRLH